MIQGFIVLVICVISGFRPSLAALPLGLLFMALIGIVIEGLDALAAAEESGNAAAVIARALLFGIEEHADRSSLDSIVAIRLPAEMRAPCATCNAWITPA